MFHGQHKVKPLHHLLSRFQERMNLWLVKIVLFFSKSKSSKATSIKPKVVASEGKSSKFVPPKPTVAAPKPKEVVLKPKEFQFKPALASPKQKELARKHKFVAARYKDPAPKAKSVPPETIPVEPKTIGLKFFKPKTKPARPDSKHVAPDVVPEPPHVAPEEQDGNFYDPWIEFLQQSSAFMFSSGSKDEGYIPSDINGVEGEITSDINGGEGDIPSVLNAGEGDMATHLNGEPSDCEVPDMEMNDDAWFSSEKSDESVYTSSDSDGEAMPQMQAVNMEDTDFQVKKQFVDSDALKDALTKHGLKKDFLWRPIKSDKKRLTVVCTGEDCPWRLHAVVLADGRKLRFTRRASFRCCRMKRFMMVLA